MGLFSPVISSSPQKNPRGGLTDTRHPFLLRVWTNRRYIWKTLQTNQTKSQGFSCLLLHSTIICVPNQIRCFPSNSLKIWRKKHRWTLVRMHLFSFQETQPAEGSSDDIGTCPQCQLTLPLPTLLWHQVKLLRHRKHYMVGVLPWLQACPALLFAGEMPNPPSAKLIFHKTAQNAVQRRSKIKYNSDTEM